MPTKLHKAAATDGGDYRGPCPWCGGEDRFAVKPCAGESGLYHCHQCGRGGDGIDFLRQYHGLSFADACRRLGLAHKVAEPAKYDRSDPAPVRLRPPTRPTRRPTRRTERTAPPAEAWRRRAREVADACEERLWSPEGKRVILWLRGRGLTDAAIMAASFGYNPADVYDEPATWGLRREKRVWTPRGITMPWAIGGEVWRLNVRRPLTSAHAAAGEARYIGPAGCGNGLYGADGVTPDWPAVLVEGELDAWSVMQATGKAIPAVATGSTSGSRRMRWTARLGLASIVLVAFDADDAGEKASRWWLDALPNALRWRPYWGDVNQMLQDGADVRAWVAAGLNTTEAA